MEPHGFSNLGGNDKPHDAQDIKLGAAGVPKYDFPAILTNEEAWAVPVEYQGHQPACGAHAGCSLEDVLRGSRFSPRFTWANIKTFDGSPVDSGTDMRSVFKSITKSGVLDFDIMGNDVSLPLNEYARPVITTAMKINASQHSGYGYGFITDLSFSGLKQFIKDHGPTVVLMRVGQEMWTDVNGKNSWQEQDVLPLRPPKIVVSGHFVLAHSYDEEYIYFLNSWSDGWGRKGHGYFGAEYMPFVNDAGALFVLNFTKDLYQGMTDIDVFRLQRYLNSNPETQVAQYGPGSPGHETNYFGDLTFAAVKKFQKLKGINPQSGYVGPLTRAVLNSVAGLQGKR